MYTQQFFIEGLGCASYIVGCEAKGVAAVVDPESRIVAMSFCEPRSWTRVLSS